PELEQLFDRQSMEANPGARRNLVWEIERKLAEDGARPIIFYNPEKGRSRRLPAIAANGRNRRSTAEG
ncbi:MAG: hypothetical protein WCB44_26605, partial [Stellaceae bacterium]